MFYEGIVEKDDVEYGYIKVRIFGKHNRDKTILPTEDLPNAKIVYSGESNIDEISYFRTICNGTWVIVSFLDDHEQHPIVLGSIVKTVDELPDFDNGFTDENGEHPSQLGTTIPSEAKTNYPHNRVLKTKKHLIEIDDTDGAERINIYHNSGSFLRFNADGSIDEEAKGDKLLTIDNLTIIADGNVSVEATGNVDIIADGDVTVDGANVDVIASGNVSVEGTNVTIESVNAEITAPTITITGATALNLVSATLITMTAPIITAAGVFGLTGILTATDFSTASISSINAHGHLPGTFSTVSGPVTGKSGLGS